MSKWQDRLGDNETAYSIERDKMDARERLYAGDGEIISIVKNDSKKRTPHIRNICAEMIESQVSSVIPQPKITPKRQEDEWRAKLIEDMIRNELDRLPMEQINDLTERISPIQGGVGYLVEWDNSKTTEKTVGELVVSTLHPKQIVPQNGVYTGIDDMDYIMLAIPQTKQYIRRRYGVSVESEGEDKPEIRGDGDESTADDMVTQYIGYERNDNGGISLFSWVNDVVLEDIEDYQSRRLRVCRKCGAVESVGDMDSMVTNIPTLDGTRPMMDEMDGIDDYTDDTPPDDNTCPYCGAVDEWDFEEQEFEDVYEPIVRSDGTVITQGATTAVVGYTDDVDAFGAPIPITEVQPTRIPYYKPDIYPIALQKNVSVYGKFLGESDIDKICTQQNTTNRVEAKIVDKLLSAGSILGLPPDANVKKTADDMRVLRGANDTLSMIKVLDLEGNISQDLAYLEFIYEEARQAIGITDSFQGRTDSTATSGTAKEFSAAQAAGRLESKRVMKEAAYSHLFELIFKFKLAYTDEPRPVAVNDNMGNPQYSEFSRWDFLESDGMGGYYWNDDFLFSCDTSAPLASNREAMWQETRLNLQTGAFGDVASTDTLILFWSRMDLLHYPAANEIKQALIEKQQREQQQAMQAMVMQQQMQQQQMAQAMAQPQRAPQQANTQTAMPTGF